MGPQQLADLAKSLSRGNGGVNPRARLAGQIQTITSAPTGPGGKN